MTNETQFIQLIHFEDKLKELDDDQLLETEQLLKRMLVRVWDERCYRTNEEKK